MAVGRGVLVSAPTQALCVTGIPARRSKLEAEVVLFGSRMMQIGSLRCALVRRLVLRLWLSQENEAMTQVDRYCDDVEGHDASEVPDPAAP